MDGWPQVLALRLAEGQREAHHTDFYKVDVGFVVRRGQPFSVVLTVDQDLREEHYFVLTPPEAFGKDTFRAQTVAKLRNHEYLVNITTCAHRARVGRIDNLVVGKICNIAQAVLFLFAVVCRDIIDILEGYFGNICVLLLGVASRVKKRSGETPVYVYPFSIYLVFNPWVEQDVAYIPSEASRREYLLKEYGNVYDGFADDYITMKWYYGQSHQVALDAAVHLLHTGVKYGFISSEDWSRPVMVAQTISRFQGMMRKAHSEEVLVGTEDALLEGDWGQHEEDWNKTNDPTLWISTIDVLDRWKRTHKPTRFGQCWVFAALQNTLMRALGVGSRQLSAFDSPIDRSFMHDKHRRMHHVVDYYYDRNGKTVWNDGTIWNFHSWIDIHLNRKNGRHSGWQAVDGTPPGNIGPSSVNAVYDLIEDLPYNDSYMISNVHSTVRRFLVSCGKNHTFRDELKGCTIERTLSYNARGLKRILSSRTLPNGSLDVHDITKDYVNHDVDAFIPYDTGNLFHTGLLTLPVMLTSSLRLDVGQTVVCGDDLRFKLSLDHPRGVLEPAQLRFSVEVVSNKGERLRLVEEGVRHISSGGSAEIVVRRHKYLEKVLVNKHLRINAMGFIGNVSQGFATKSVRLVSPKLDLVIPSVVRTGSTFVAQVTVTNPYHHPVRNVCLAIESHEFDVPHPEKCVRLLRGKHLQHKLLLRADSARPGLHYVVASLRGDFLPPTRIHKEIILMSGNSAEVTATTV